MNSDESATAHPSGDPAPPARRAYRSPVRVEQAAATRRRLLAAAADCFAENGYAGTSLRTIADRAGVSVETVQLNGPKAELMLAAYEQAFAGEEGQTSLLEREPVRSLLAETDPRVVVALLVDFMVPANAASADLGAALEAAARSDPKIAEAAAGLRLRAITDSRAGAAFVASLGGVPSGRPLDEVGDELWFLVRSSHYLDLVRGAGWSVAQYRAWLLRSISALLL